MATNLLHGRAHEVFAPIFLRWYYPDQVGVSAEAFSHLDPPLEEYGKIEAPLLSGDSRGVF
jgi:hypothetical protein